MKGFGKAVFVATVAALAMTTVGCVQRKATVQRYGSVIGIKPENIAEYKKLHAAVWPEVLSKLEAVNIRNYSIYLAELKKGEWYLFSYFDVHKVLNYAFIIDIVVTGGFIFMFAGTYAGMMTAGS